ncbi:indole-3-glycerol phosphate synthase TrpC [Staphylococcus epidermidis]|uniref:indole-3-glycerol phosphate synthase TrpC n=1 Tax=Staphylococcus epidermidis TaxID=1282 RepID=UPI002091ECC5|nr:indole-3-glycerol phosphate synthase TrpC [Staphylococcus epidermidis]MCO6236232.1 indole-3-glycerol phosphate synthase TrpC [Staphylococcus epidermidis]
MTILNEIIEYKKTLLERKYYDKKLEILQDNGNVKRRKLIDSLNYDKTLSVIAEIKSKSPSVPQLPQRDLIQQVKDYQKYGANAISILIDEKYFGGSFERLNQLSKITSLPVLCKDFIIDKIQIDVAKRAGASIILLIVNILSDDQLKELYSYATNHNLEVHTIRELERAHQINPKIIGVNNRDLKRFETDVLHTNKLLKFKKSNCCYISESGIHTKEDVEKIVDSSIDGLLVGEALMKTNDLSQFLPSLKLKKNLYDS